MSIRIPGGGGSSGGSGDLSADGTGWPTTAAVTFGEDLTIATTKNIHAAADGTSDIGTGSKRFNLGYFDRLNLDNGANNAVVLTVQATDAGANAGTIGISSFLTANSLGAAIRGQATLGLAARFETVGASANPVVYIEGDTSHTGYLLALGTEAVTHTAISVDGDTYLRVPPAAAAGASVAGLPLNVTAGVAVASTDTAGAAAGGAVTITAGAAARNTSGNANGGDVNLVTGTGIGTGTVGVVRVKNGANTLALQGGGAAVASATAMPVPTGRVFHVTGTTTITSVLATNFAAGAVVTLIFDGVLTFTDGSNLKLAGDFVTTADDTITIAYDGSNWFEVCRSVN